MYHTLGNPKLVSRTRVNVLGQYYCPGGCTNAMCPSDASLEGLKLLD